MAPPDPATGPEGASHNEVWGTLERWGATFLLVSWMALRILGVAVAIVFLAGLVLGVLTGELEWIWLVRLVI